MREQSVELAGERLHKLMARAGIASRRASEDLIRAGRVQVDGIVVSDLGTRVDPSQQTVVVDGSRITLNPELVYLALNKPRGMLSTMRDERGRPCVGDVVAGRRERLFHVGRLDADSEGLLLLMNDGELAHPLMHPSTGVSKTYLVEVAGRSGATLARALRAGVDLDDGPARADRVKVVGDAPGRTLLEIELHEGRTHIIRRMLAAVDRPVLRLVRTAVGPVRLGELRPGRTRPLTAAEIGSLWKSIGR